MDGQFLSIRKFADKMNTSEGNVRKAIKAGKITEASIDLTNPKRPKINFKKAKAEWAKNFIPEKIQNQKLADTLEGKIPAEMPKQESTETANVEVSETELVIPDGASYQDAMRIKEIFKARTAQLEYNEKRGTLVEKDAVYKEFFAIAQSVRSSMQGMPDKIIDHIIAEFNIPIESRDAAHKIMYNEITEALEILSTKPTFK